MKIGVFGDSFAESTSDEIWWRYLHTLHGHEVRCFGEGGSSLVWSAKKILENYRDFEFVIWCVTSSQRITVWHRADYREIAVHVTGSNISHPNPEMQQKIEATRQYLIHAWDAPDNEFISECIIEKVKNTVSNMLLIPCFGPPLYLDCPDPKFNLFTLSEMEARYYFPNTSLVQIYQAYDDLRQGHLTQSSNIKLAEIVNGSLRPGILCAEYEVFPAPIEPLGSVFSRRKH